MRLVPTLLAVSASAQALHEGPAVLWQSRLPQRNLADAHYHYDGDSHNLNFDEHNVDLDDDTTPRTRNCLLL